jgi:uncharacterized membrane protein YqhA
MSTSTMARFLAACRLLLLVPVIGCVLMTAGVLVMGLIRVVTATAEVLEKGDFSSKAAKTISLGVIEVIDLFLIGTVSYITAVGLYRLFISKHDIDLPMRLKIDSLKDLEDKIVGVIVAALAVAFLGQAAGSDEPAQLLNYGGGIALVIVALAFFVRPVGSAKSADSKSSDEP